MHLEDLSGYINHLDDLKEQFRDQIRVISGIEIDSCPGRSPLLNNLPMDELSRLDFVLFEYIGDELWKGISFEDFIEIRKNINNRVGLAHWYVSDVLKKNDSLDLARAIRDNDLFIEIISTHRYNIDGEPYYELERIFFEQLAAMDVRFTIGTDTHEDIDIVGQVDNEVEFLNQINASILNLE